MNKILILNTKEKQEVINITQEVGKIVAESKVIEGICLLNVLHTTAAILINEDESGFKNDVLTLLGHIIPGKNWEHNCKDNNASSHLAASLISSSVSLPINKGILGLGTWQKILFVELDGPRTNRQVMVQIVK